MEKQVQELSEITAAFKDHVLTLKNLAEQVAKLGGRIARISSKYGLTDQNLDVMEKRTPEIRLPGYNAVACNLSNIIPFPKTYSHVNRHPELSVPKEEHASLSLFLAVPGKSLPAAIPDYRSSLQRDGLILLAWDMRKTEEGFRFTAYWVTSTGIPRFYASRSLSSEDFSSAIPDRKSYAAEDGIEFYGQKSPVYIVHVAPELMKSNPRHDELRAVHISALKHQGSEVDFCYRYLLKNEKKRGAPPKKRDDHSPQQTGA